MSFHTPAAASGEFDTAERGGDDDDYDDDDDDREEGTTEWTRRAARAVKHASRSRV